MAANKQADNVYHVRKQLQIFGFRQRKPSELYCDSKTWAMTHSAEQKTRAIRTKDHRIRRYYVKRKVIKVVPILGTENPADLFTKHVKETAQFKKHTAAFMNAEVFLKIRNAMMNLPVS